MPPSGLWEPESPPAPPEHQPLLPSPLSGVFWLFPPICQHLPRRQACSIVARLTACSCGDSADFWVLSMCRPLSTASCPVISNPPACQPQPQLPGSRWPLGATRAHAFQVAVQDACGARHVCVPSRGEHSPMPSAPETGFILFS